MLSAQFLASSLRESHPSFHAVSAPSGPRQMKATLQSAHLADVNAFLVDGKMPLEVYNRAKQDLHGKFVENYLSDQELNPIIQRRPFPVHPSEESLPRYYRSLLAQLQSGYSNYLNTYKHKINAATSPTCPRCNADDDTSSTEQRRRPLFHPQIFGSIL